MECMGSGNFGDSNLSFVQRLSSFQSSSVGLLEVSSQFVVLYLRFILNSMHPGFYAQSLLIPPLPPLPHRISIFEFVVDETQEDPIVKFVGQDPIFQYVSMARYHVRTSRRTSRHTGGIK